MIMALPAIAMAAQSSSNTYQINEAFFGAGGELHACSTTFCSKQAAGELAVGKTCSNGAIGYCAEAGFNTDRYPYIEFDVNNTNIDLGALNAGTPATANATFSVKAYLSSGYTVINASDPPKNGNYTMDTLDTVPTASDPGTEQFGINLAANTDPVAFGAIPTYDPDNTFSFGLVTADYSGSDVYKYKKDDVVAYSTSSSSYTDYTVSYLFNTSNLTPGGTYIFRHVLVATATY